MSKQIVITAKASTDLDAHFAYIAEGDMEAALRFFDAARATFAQIARLPKIGNLYPLKNPKLKGLRKWPIKGFKKYLIFYLNYDSEVQIVRVLYGSQNLFKILEKDT